MTALAAIDVSVHDDNRIEPVVDMPPLPEGKPSHTEDDKKKEHARRLRQVLSATAQFDSDQVEESFTYDFTLAVGTDLTHNQLTLHITGSNRLSYNYLSVFGRTGSRFSGDTYQILYQRINEILVPVAIFPHEVPSI